MSAWTATNRWTCRAIRATVSSASSETGSSKRSRSLRPQAGTSASASASSARTRTTYPATAHASRAAVWRRPAQRLPAPDVDRQGARPLAQRAQLGRVGAEPLDRLVGRLGDGPHERAERGDGGQEREPDGDGVRHPLPEPRPQRVEQDGEEQRERERHRHRLRRRQKPHDGDGDEHPQQPARRGRGGHGRGGEEEGKRGRGAGRPRLRLLPSSSRAGGAVVGEPPRPAPQYTGRRAVAAAHATASAAPPTVTSADRPRPSVVPGTLGGSPSSP